MLKPRQCKGSPPSLPNEIWHHIHTTLMKDSPGWICHVWNLNWVIWEFPATLVLVSNLLHIIAFSAGCQNAGPSNSLETKTKMRHLDRNSLGLCCWIFSTQLWDNCIITSLRWEIIGSKPSVLGSMLVQLPICWRVSWWTSKIDLQRQLSLICSYFPR